MASTSYTYSIATDFASGVSGNRFAEEVLASSITTTFEMVETDGDNFLVWFADALTAGEETTLDGLVAAHSGADLRPLVSVPVMLLEPTGAGATKVVVNDRPGIEFQTGQTAWAATTAVWPLQVYSAAQMRVQVRFVLRAAGTGTAVRICARAKATGIGADSSETWTDTAFVATAVTHTTLGEVFDAVVWLDVSSFNEGDSVALQVGRDGNDELGAGTSDDCSEAVQVISVDVRAR